MQSGTGRRHSSPGTGPCARIAGRPQGKGSGCFGRRDKPAPATGSTVLPASSVATRFRINEELSSLDLCSASFCKEKAGIRQGRQAIGRICRHRDAGPRTLPRRSRDALWWSLQTVVDRRACEQSGTRSRIGREEALHVRMAIAPPGRIVPPASAICKHHRAVQFAFPAQPPMSRARPAAPGRQEVARPARSERPHGNRGRLQSNNPNSEFSQRRSRPGRLRQVIALFPRSWAETVSRPFHMA